MQDVIKNHTTFLEARKMVSRFVQTLPVYFVFSCHALCFNMILMLDMNQELLVPYVIKTANSVVLGAIFSFLRILATEIKLKAVDHNY